MDIALVARDYRTGDRLRVIVEDGVLARVEPADPLGGADAASDPGLDPWVAPALWDLQMNGRWGRSFSDGSIAVEDVGRIVRAQAGMGVSRLCPTLITAGAEALRHGVRAIASACDADPELDRRVLGIHLEGPWISPEDGYRGAHPREHVRAPSWAEFERLQRASGSRIVMVTLAPERPGAIEFIARLTEAGVVAAIGHSAADLDTIERAVAAGLTFSTHLGNGLPATLPRHPNPIWWQAAHDGLSASFIADGFHLDPLTLAALVRIKTLARTVLVSDASPLAGAEPGVYGPWEVREDGRITVSGTPYLAGSNLALIDGVRALVRASGASLSDAIDSATLRPARLLGRMPPALEAGQPADLILFRSEVADREVGLDLLATCVGGEWTMAGGGG